MDRWWMDECVWAAGRWMKNGGRKSGRVNLMMIDGRMAGLMKESVDGWRDGHELISGWISRCVNVWTDKWIEEMIEQWIDRWMDEGLGGEWTCRLVDTEWMNVWLTNGKMMDGWMHGGVLDEWWMHCLNEWMTQRDGSMGEWMEEVDALFSNRMWDRCMNHRMVQRILGWRDELLNGLINSWINFSSQLIVDDLLLRKRRTPPWVV